MSRKLHFLVIDDSPPVIEVYKQLLQKAGHKVSAFHSCSHALDHIIQEKPDCVLCDLMLPGMDGLELYKHLQQKKNIKQPVFIIITAKQYDYDRREAQQLGIDGYLTKPVNQTTFVDELMAIIARREK